jgi:hypothetical protein
MFTTNNPGDKFTTHSGGLVTITPTGLIHQAGKGYGGMDQDDNSSVVQPVVKRGRGRPRNNPTVQTSHLQFGI